MFVRNNATNGSQKTAFLIKHNGEGAGLKQHSSSAHSFLTFLYFSFCDSDSSFLGVSQAADLLISAHLDIWTLGLNGD